LPSVLGGGKKERGKGGKAQEKASLTILYEGGERETWLSETHSRGRKKKKSKKVD